MKEAIQKAIEGGWKPVGFPLTEEPIEEMGVFIADSKSLDADDDPYSIRFFNTEYPEEGYNYSTNIEMIVLDPEFWKGLGKTIGWKSEAGSFYDNIAWQEKWHRFIDHLAEGKDVESFFKELLN